MPVWRAFGFGARGGGPEGLRMLAIAGGAEAEGTGGGMLGRMDDEDGLV